jgi:dTDP-4-amino-4,6-dideoxygalactose transaminase
MPEADYGEPSSWLTVITVDDVEFGATPERIRVHLESLDIEARHAWKPMHLQDVYRGTAIRGGAVAEEIFRTGVCLPSGSAMTEDDIGRVVEGLLSARG